MKTDRIIAGVLIFLSLSATISGLTFQRSSKPVKSINSGNMFKFGELSLKNPDIAVIDVYGPIMYGSTGGFSSTNVDANQMIPLLEEIKKDNVKGILLRLNSPGGTASASQAIYEKIQAIKKSSNIKVVSFMQDVAASGAYYIASSSDYIYANPSTLTGSIGVIMQVPNYTDLGNKVGYKVNTIKSGRYKDLGNASRNMTNDEKDLLQNLIDDTYNEFVTAVSKGRNIPINTLKPLADGRIYTGNQAKYNKLVDGLGSETDALKWLAKELKIDGEPKLKNYSKPSWEKLLTDFNSKSLLSGTVFDVPEFSTKFNKIPLMLYK